MPYEGEFAGYIPLKRILESEQVKGLRDRAKVATKSSRERVAAATIVADIAPSKYMPDFYHCD